MKSKRNLILEVGEKTIKVCQVRVSRRGRVIDFLKVWEFPSAITPKDIEGTFLKYARTRYAHVVFSLSRQFFLVRSLELPSHEREEIKKMIPFQLAKKLPCPLEEIVYNFSLQANVKKGTSSVTIYLITEKKIQQLLGFLEKNRAVFSTITMTSWGLKNWIDFETEFSKPELASPVLLIDSDKDHLEMAVMDRENLIFSRAFFYANDEECQAGLTQSLKILEKEFGKIDFSSIVFTGNRKENVLTMGNLKRGIFIPCAEHFPITKKMRALPGIQEGEEDAFSFASLLGLALEKNYSRFDFSPQFLKEKRRGRAKKKRFLDIMVVTLEIIFLSGLLLFKYSFDQSAHVRVLNSKLETIREEARELDKAEQKLKILDQRLGRHSLSAILHDLISSVPEQARLTLLDFRDNGEFSLKGYAGDIAHVFVMVNQLNDSPLLSDVKIKFASKVKRRNQEMVEFYVYGDSQTTEGALR